MKHNTATTPWRKWWWAGVLLAGLVVALAAAFRPKTLTVEVAQVQLGRFEQVLEEDGKLRLRDRHTLHAPVAGTLLRPGLRVGDAIRKGQVIAELTPATPQLIDNRTRQVLLQRLGSAEAAVQTAQAQTAQAASTYALAQREAERARQLAHAGFFSSATQEQVEQSLRSAEQAWRAAEAQSRKARFGLAEARAALASPPPDPASTRGHRLALHSPVAGRVIKVHQASGGPVAAGQALLDLGDLQAMEAVIDVLTSDVTRVQPDAAVHLFFGPEVPSVIGRVQRVEPVGFTKVSALGIEEQRVHVIVDIADLPDARLGDGFRVEARIIWLTQDGALLIPTAALVRDAANWKVFVVEGGRARSRPVHVQSRHARQAWVSEGLQEGESVILYPGQLIQDGQRVRVQFRP